MFLEMSVGRKVKDTSLQSRQSRRDLKQRDEPYWRAISEGLHIGYRKGPRGGVWRVRLFLDGKYIKRTLGVADDILDADGSEVLTWTQAQHAAQAFDREVKSNKGVIRGPLTVATATERYLEWLKANRKASTVKVTISSLRAHVLPALGDREISSLTADEIRSWLHKLGNKPARLRTSRLASKQRHKERPSTDNEKRARKATANRIFTILKAVLNKAFHDDLVSSDMAWRRVKPFESVDSGTIRYLSTDESKRLVNAASTDIRRLIQGALYTGARFGELARLTVADIDLSGARVFVSAASKSGKSRYVPLNDEGVKFFTDLIAGKTGIAFLKADDTPWGTQHYTRPFAEANRLAKIIPAIRFHDLRHTYATMVANIPGNTLDVLSEILGHADTRVTRRHYAFLFDDTKKRAVANLPSLGYKPQEIVKALSQPTQRAVAGNQ